MKVLNLAQFREAPKGTVYQRNFSEVLEIKDETLESDFCLEYLAGKLTSDQETFCEAQTGVERDGLYEDDTIFYVYELHEVEYMIARLTESLELVKEYYR